MSSGGRKRKHSSFTKQSRLPKGLPTGWAKSAKPAPRGGECRSSGFGVVGSQSTGRAPERKVISSKLSWEPTGGGWGEEGKGATLARWLVWKPPLAHPGPWPIERTLTGALQPLLPPHAAQTRQAEGEELRGGGKGRATITT